MGRLVDRIQALALALGAPGLFLVAVLDSSILSLPAIADLLKEVTFRPPAEIFETEKVLDLGGVRVRLLRLGPATHAATRWCSSRAIACCFPVTWR